MKPLQTQAKPRIQFIDLAKGICIILVIAHHLVEMSPFYKFASCFHVPVFFCLSGLFFKPTTSIAEFLHKKVNMILLPLVGWYLIAYVINVAAHGMFTDLNERLAHITDIFTHTYFYDIPLWFLLVLFEMNIILTLLYNVLRNQVAVGVAVLALMFTGWYLSAVWVDNVMHIASAFSCLPFFYIGCLLKYTPLMRQDVTRRQMLGTAAIAVGLLTIGSLCAFMPERMARMSYCYNYLWHEHIWLIYLTTVTLMLGVIFACKSIGDIPLVSYLGRYSLIVLVTHDVLGDIGSRLLYMGFGDTLDFETRCWINFAIVTLSMFIVIPLCRRYLPYISAQRQLPIQSALQRLG